MCVPSGDSRPPETELPTRNGTVLLTRSGASRTDKDPKPSRVGNSGRRRRPNNAAVGQSNRDLHRRFSLNEWCQSRRVLDVHRVQVVSQPARRRKGEPLTVRSPDGPDVNRAGGQPPAHRGLRVHDPDVAVALARQPACDGEPSSVGRKVRRLLGHRGAKVAEWPSVARHPHEPTSVAAESRPRQRGLRRRRAAGSPSALMKAAHRS